MDRSVVRDMRAESLRRLLALGELRRCDRRVSAALRAAAAFAPAALRFRLTAAFISHATGANQLRGHDGQVKQREQGPSCAKQRRSDIRRRATSSHSSIPRENREFETRALSHSITGQIRRDDEFGLRESVGDSFSMLLFGYGRTVKPASSCDAARWLSFFSSSPGDSFFPGWWA